MRLKVLGTLWGAEWVPPQECCWRKEERVTCVGGWRPGHFHSGSVRSCTKALAPAQTHSCPLTPSNAAEHHLSKVSSAAEPNTQVPAFLSRSYRTFWAPVLWPLLLPGVCRTHWEIRGRSDTTAPGPGSRAHSCSPHGSAWQPRRQKRPSMSRASSPAPRVLWQRGRGHQQSGCTAPALISPAFVCVWFLSRLEVVTVTTSSMNHVSVKKQSFNCLT